MKKNYSFITKKVFLTLLMVGLSLMSMATTYYVSNSGNDVNSGITATLAWNKVNTITFKAGDQILFQRGSTFYGSLIINQSGTSGNPIIFGAYGTGSNPIITGFTTVTTWTNLGNNIWESTNAVTTLASCNVVSINGINTAMGKFPNENDPNLGYLFIDSYSGNTSLSSSSLNGTNWIGSEIVVRNSQYQLQRRVITSQTLGTIGWDTDISGLAKGEPFFIQNGVNTLTQQSEWCFNTTSKKITVYSTTSPLNIKVPTIDQLVIINNAIEYINITNIDFSGANLNAIYRWPYGTPDQRSHDFNVSNCNFSFCGTDAISMRINNLSIENNTISDSNGGGIVSDANSNVVIRGNTIINSAIYKGMQQGWGATSAVSISNVVGGLLEYNSIINCGYDGINYSDVGTNSIIIRHNFINNFCIVLSDGGGIYGNINAQILNNIVINGGPNVIKLWNYDSWAVGIYLDDNSFNNEVGYNTIYNCNRVGIYLHNSHQNNIHDNISYDNLMWQIYINDDLTGGQNVIANNINNNQFIAKTSTEEINYYQSQYNNLLTFGTFDYNIYTRPISETSVMRTDEPLIGTVFNNLATWKIFSGQDAHSQKSPQTLTTINDFQFEYNATKTAKIIILSQPMIDVKGSVYADSIRLQPYTSVVLMKVNNPTEILSFTLSGQIGNSVINSGSNTIGITMPNKTSIANLVTTFTLSAGATAKVGTTVQVSGTTANSFENSLVYVVTAQDGTTTKEWTIKVSVLSKESVQTINLKSGWNIVSFNVLPSNTNFNEIFQPLIKSGVLVKIQDEKGNFIVNTDDGWYSNLDTLDIRKGYNVKVSTDVQLTVIGEPVSANSDIPLSLGFNIIGYPLTKSHEALSSFQSLTDEGSLIKVQDETGKFIIKNGSTWFSDIDSLQPGKGYYVNVSQNSSMNFGSLKSGKISTANEMLKSTTYFQKSFSGNPYLAMVFLVRNLTKSNLRLNAGDEIGIFDGTACVGSGVFDGTNSFGLSAGMADPISHTNGFNYGDTIHFQIWKPTEQMLIKNITVIYMNSSRCVFVPLETAFIEIQAQLVSAVPTITTEILKIKNYPNPFTSSTTFEFTVNETTNVTLEIYDILGKKVTELVKQKYVSGSYSITWNGTNTNGQPINPGMYVYCFRAGNFISSKKLLFSRQ